MEINNGYYKMNPDKYIAEIKELKEALKNDEDYTCDYFDDDVMEIRDEFFGKCYEKAEDLGYVHRGPMAQSFMDDFDRQAGIRKIANEKSYERHFVLTD